MKTAVVFGQEGFVGGAVTRGLVRAGYTVMPVPRKNTDLRDLDQAAGLLCELRPETVVIAAGRCSGIVANIERPGEHAYTNLAIQTACLEACRLARVQNTVILGSSCAYPRDAPQPITEDALLSGPLEKTNEGYAIAKVAALVMAEAYHRQYGMRVLRLMPTNMYGPRDHFDPATAHVLPALMRKIDDALRTGADEVVIMGSGQPRREFMFVDDFGDAVPHLLASHFTPDLVNVGTGTDVSIADAANIMAFVMGYKGRIVFQYRGPDGTPRKLLDVSKALSCGWRAKTSLTAGLAQTWEWYRGSR